MELAAHLRNLNSESLEYFDRVYSELTRDLDSKEREALQWFRRGLRSNTFEEKQDYYQKARHVLGEFLLK